MKIKGISKKSVVSKFEGKFQPRHLVDELVSKGFSKEAAREYIATGCVRISHSSECTDWVTIKSPKAICKTGTGIELILKNVKGRAVGLSVWWCGITPNHLLMHK